MQRRPRRKQERSNCAPSGENIPYLLHCEWHANAILLDEHFDENAHKGVVLTDKQGANHAKLTVSVAHQKQSGQQRIPLPTWLVANDQQTDMY
jgi:hypothetical protein